MKKAFFLSPAFAAVLFTIPKSWELMNQPDSAYIPVVFEFLLLLLGYVTAFAVNLVVIVPFCLLVRLKTSNLLAGLGLAALIALTGTTVAYAYEIFEYQSSILHPRYLYPLLLPLLVMTFVSFFLVTRRTLPKPVATVEEDGEEAAG